LLPTNLPTIWDNLLAAGVSARYYWSNIPILFFWGNKYFLNGITTPFPNIGSFVSDAQNGTLPAVSFVDPAFTGFSAPGTTNDDHPPAHIQAGDTFLANVFLAVANGPQWPSTVFVVTYDTSSPELGSLPLRNFLSFLQFTLWMEQSLEGVGHARISHELADSARSNLRLLTCLEVIRCGKESTHSRRAFEVIEYRGSHCAWKSRNRRGISTFRTASNNNKLDDRDHFLENATASVASLRGLITSTPER
jgi:hypothetical protein